jgi:hypothetical protein
VLSLSNVAATVTGFWQAVVPLHNVELPPFNVAPVDGVIEPTHELAFNA